jgi:N-acetylglutamate synthase-like GNAT family acetyltransferase
MPGTILSPLAITNCSAEDFLRVKKYISEFCLDDNDLKPEQFLVAKHGAELVGFGRLRSYSGCSELCSLGVVEAYRKKGVGSQLSKTLIRKSNSPLYTVTVIPEFFERLGSKPVVPSRGRSRLNWIIAPRR